MSTPIIWEVTPTQWETLAEYADMLANAAISQQDYVERLRSMGMPACGPGAHVRILVTSARRGGTISAAALQAGQFPDPPY